MNPARPSRRPYGHRRKLNSHPGLRKPRDHLILHRKSLFSQNHLPKRLHSNQPKPTLRIRNPHSQSLRQSCARPLIHNSPRPGHRSHPSGPISHHQIRIHPKSLHLRRIMLPISIQRKNPLKPRRHHRLKSLPQRCALSQIHFISQHHRPGFLRFGSRRIRTSIVHHPNRRHLASRFAHDGRDCPRLVIAGYYGGAASVNLHEPI